MRRLIVRATPQTNGRATIADDDNDFWPGFEQEYTIWNPEFNKLGLTAEGYPAPQGPHYCSVGQGKAVVAKSLKSTEWPKPTQCRRHQRQDDGSMGTDFRQRCQRGRRPIGRTLPARTSCRRTTWRSMAAKTSQRRLERQRHAR